MTTVSKLLVGVLIIALIVNEYCETKSNRRRGSRRRRTKARLSDSQLKNLLSESAGNFSLSMYKVLSPSYNNFVFSPIGVQMALSMAYLSARGSTARELQTRLNFMKMKTPRNVHKIFRRLTDSLRYDVGNVTVNVVNAMYVHRPVSLRNRFVRKMRRFYKARVKTFDFTPTSGPVASINKWVKKKSRRKIKYFLSPDSISPQSLLILINAVYFRGEWKQPFDENSTSKALFKSNPSESIYTDMMETEGDFKSKHISALACKSLELPYAGGRFSLFILLPDASGSLADLEENLTINKLEELLNITNQPTRMRVRLPKLKLEIPIQLRSEIQKIGVEEIFKAKAAELTGINGKRRSLHVDYVAHKSCIEIDERGTNGQSSWKPSLRLSPTNSPLFHIDRPFLFFVRDKEFAINLLMGKFVQPSG